MTRQQRRAIIAYAIEDTHHRVTILGVFCVALDSAKQLDLEDNDEM